MVKKTALLTLDTQSLDLNIPFKGIYNTVSKTMKALRFSKAVGIAENLKQQGTEAKIIALDSRAEDFLNQRGISTIAAKDAIENLYDLKYGEVTFGFLRNLIGSLEANDEKSTYKGVSLPDIDIKNLWRSFVFPAVTALDSYVKIIEKERPQKAIVLNNEHYFQKIFKIAAENSGIAVADKTNALAKLPWFAKRFAIKNFGGIMAPKYLRQINGCDCVKSTKKLKKRILIAHDTISPGKILPWAKKIAKDYDIVYVGVRESGDEFKKAGIKYRKLQDYFTAGIINNLRQARKEFECDYYAVSRNPEIAKALSYNGIGTKEILDEMLLYMHYIGYPIAAAYVELFSNVIEIERPDIVVTVDELSRFGRALVKVANSHGVKTMVVQHGALLDHPLFSNIIAEKFAAFGAQTKNLLVKRGTNAEQVIIVGQAEETPKERPEKIRAKICAALNLNSKKPIITFASQGRGEESVNYQSLKVFYNAAKSFPELQFVTKLHPDESEKLHAEFVRKLDLCNVTIIKDIKIKELLLASDIVVNIYSTVGMEALSLGKPLISLTASMPESYFPQGKGAYRCKNADSVKKAINNCITSKISEKTIKATGKYYIQETGEKACSNVAKAIANLIK